MTLGDQGEHSSDTHTTLYTRKYVKHTILVMEIFKT